MQGTHARKRETGLFLPPAQRETTSCAFRSKSFHAKRRTTAAARKRGGGGMGRGKLTRSLCSPSARLFLAKERRWFCFGTEHRPPLQPLFLSANFFKHPLTPITLLPLADSATHITHRHRQMENEDDMERQVDIHCYTHMSGD